MTNRKTPGPRVPLLEVLVLCAALVWTAGLAMLYSSLEPTAIMLRDSIEWQKARLGQLGIAHEQMNEQEIADALAKALSENSPFEGIRRRAELAKQRRSAVYAQVKDRLVLGVASYLFTFRKPEDTVLALAESGVAVAFWPGIAQVFLLWALGLRLCLRARRLQHMRSHSGPRCVVCGAVSATQGARCSVCGASLQKCQ